MLSDEVTLILKGQNLSKAALDEAIASLKEFRTTVRSTVTALTALGVSMGKFTETTARMDAAMLRIPGRFSDISAVARSQTDTINTLAASYGRLALAQVDASSGGRAGGTPTATASASRGGFGGGGLLGNLAQGAVFAGIYGAYSGIRGSIGQAVNFNATTASTAATTGISASGLRQVTNGILQIAGSGNSRYDANTLLQGAYSIISTGITDPNAVLSTLRAAAASATAANATGVSPSTSTLTTVLNAYGSRNLSRDALRFQDVITQAINQGKIDPSQAPQAIATYAKSARAAGASFADASGLFAFDTLTASTGQQAGQDTKAFFDSINNPNGQQRKIASLLGLDIGSGSLKRAGGVNNLIGNYLSATAGDNQGLLLERLLGNKDAVSLIQGAAANPTKLTEYLANAGGTGKTVSGANTFLQSDAGKLYSATNELKTVFQKFSDGAIPLLTTAVQDATAGIQALGVVGAKMDALARTLNIPGHVADAGNWVDGIKSAGIGLGMNIGAALFGGGSGSSGQLTPAQAAALQARFNVAATVSNDPLRNQGYTAPPSGSAFTNNPASINGGLGTTSAVTGALPFNIAGAIASVSNTFTNARQTSAVAYANRLPVTRKTADITAAQSALSLALGTNAPIGVINSALSSLVGAINASSADASTKQYEIYQARQAVQAYTQQLTASAAAAAAQGAQTSYTQASERLQIAQLTGTGASAATAGVLNVLRANPSLYNNDPLQLKIMELQLQSSASGTGSIPRAVTDHLIRPNLPVDQLQANFGQSVARLTGGAHGGANETIRELQKENANLREQIAELKGLKQSSKNVEKYTAASARANEKVAAAMTAPAARNSPLRNAKGIRH